VRWWIILLQLVDMLLNCVYVESSFKVFCEPSSAGTMNGNYGETSQAIRPWNSQIPFPQVVSYLGLKCVLITPRPPIRNSPRRQSMEL
jgi:hypothetical protein